MLYNLYTIFDRVTGTYGDPFLAVNEADCKRKTAYSFRSNPYKSDMVLYFLGTFDPADAKISLSPMPVMVCNIDECYEVAENG